MANVKKSCLNCNKEFIERFPSWPRKFCSKICANRTIAKNKIGTKRPPEVGRKISKSRKGQKPSPQCIAAAILVNTGRPKSEKWKEAMKKRSGPNNGNWNGGQSNCYGYVRIMCKDHPYARNGYIMEHRLVMEKHIGRYLLPEEQVHHINKIRGDNRIENLQLFSSNSEHMKHHFLQGDTHLHWQHKD